MEQPGRMDIDRSANVQVSFNQKWEIHKPFLKRLYLEENLKLPKIKCIMRDEHGFDAEVHQYKYRFDKWDWKKSMSSKTKAGIVGKSQKRLNAGQGTVVKYQTRVVDSRKLIRFEKTQRKKQTSTILFAQNAGGSRHAFTFNGIAGNTMTFMNWNLPYQALLRHFPQLMDHPSPSAMSVSTPSDVSIASPSADAALSPGLAQAVKLRTTRQNAALFVTGDFEGLLRAFSTEDKKVFSTWMYEFWYFGFITAKHWGRGPRKWTVDDLWQDFQNAASPGLLAPSPPAHPSSLAPQSPGSGGPSVTQASLPPALCRWSIHISMDGQDHIDWLDEDEQAGSCDNLSQAWPGQWLSEPLEQKLQEGLDLNSFSTVKASHLPVDLGLISQVARKSQDEIWREALGFAIMGRNSELLERMLTPESREDAAALSKRDTEGIHPVHLAATYLDGGKSCCQIMSFLLSKSTIFDRKAFDRDSKGHSVFDTLMLRILRSHSGTPLEVVDDALRGIQGYAGEEVDICGRWDAESDSYRKLLGSGAVKVPLSWKHKFCHTSIQAICHSIQRLSLPSLLSTSGLFLRRCSSCVLTLEPRPLHTLVLTAVLLLENGMDGEDLFGMICCLLQVTVAGAYKQLLSFSKSNVSTHPLQDGMDHDACAHAELSPWELAMQLEVTAQKCGSPEALKGWTAFVLILQHIEEQHRWVSEKRPPQGYEEDHEAILEAYENYDDIFDEDRFHDRPELNESLLMQEIFQDGELDFPNVCQHLDSPEEYRAFGRNTHLGHIWAACQAELLTYRRQQEDLPWLSKNITIDAILECLRTGNPEVLPHIKNNLLEPYCACGFYEGWATTAHREQACASYFSNLDDWHKTSFIPVFDE